MKFDTSIQKAIFRLKAPDNQRVTSNLREAVELVSGYLGYLGTGADLLRGGYRATVLQSELGSRAYLTKGTGINRIAFVATSRPLWDASGAVQAAGTEHMREFVREVSQGLLEAIGEQLGKFYAEKLREVAKLLGKNGFEEGEKEAQEVENPFSKRATDWSGVGDHA